MLAGLIVSLLMVFCVVALAFTVRMDRILAGPPEPVHPAEFEGTGDL
jgi:nitrate reductase NapE component